MGNNPWRRWLVRRSRSTRQGRRPGGRFARPRLEVLEARDVPAVFHTNYLIHSHGGSHPLGTPGPTGWSPSQVRHAYGFDRITFNNGAVAGDGSGETIAIVDAYNDPNILHDLAAFDAQFNLPGASTDGSSSDYVGNYLTVENQNGGSSLPSASGGWVSEIALDVEWAHAIAPGAKILLVEANNALNSNLLTAVSTAARADGVVAVSMSWGGGEFSGETSSSYENYFTTPGNHPGVTFVAASGDSGAPPIWPAVSKNVVAVGGTTLNLDSSGNITSETGWGGSGGGISRYEAQPGYQSGVVTQSSTKRTGPDVAYGANPNTGFSVYDSYTNGLTNPWSQIGGTSDAAPQWAALTAIADQGRALLGLGSLDGPGQTLPALYSMSSLNFHDITSGTSNGSPHYSAGVGYDLVTGLGTPYADRIVYDLAGPLQQGGFEAPNVGTGSAAYQYNPGGSAWTFDAGSGISGNGSALTDGNPNAPEGTQVAFLQGYGTFSQSASFAAGTYTISFLAAQRGDASQAGSQTFEVLVDGVVVGTFTPTDANYASYATGQFTVTAGTHTVEFLGTDPAGQGNTAFIDSVRTTLVAGIGDPGFENPNVGTGSAAYQYNPGGSAWTFDNNSGVAGNGSDLTAGNPDAPEGSQVAFLQATGTFSQSVVFAAGTYTLSFSAAQRYGNASSQTFQVLVDGVVVGTFTPTDVNYASYTTGSFTVAAGAHTVTFVGTDPDGGDNTAFIDAVHI